jgi:hypothetical protein
MLLKESRKDLALMNKCYKLMKIHMHCTNLLGKRKKKNFKDLKKKADLTDRGELEVINLYT